MEEEDGVERMVVFPAKSVYINSEKKRKKNQTARTAKNTRDLLR